MTNVLGLTNLINLYSAPLFPSSTPAALFHFVFRAKADSQPPPPYVPPPPAVGALRAQVVRCIVPERVMHRLPNGDRLELGAAQGGSVVAAAGASTPA
jgi:hypothetical protein